MLESIKLAKTPNTHKHTESPREFEEVRSSHQCPRSSPTSGLVSNKRHPLGLSPTDLGGPRWKCSQVCEREHREGATQGCSLALPFQKIETLYEVCYKHTEDAIAVPLRQVCLCIKQLGKIFSFKENPCQTYWWIQKESERGVCVDRNVQLTSCFMKTEAPSSVGAGILRKVPYTYLKKEHCIRAPLLVRSMFLRIAFSKVGICLRKVPHTKL